MLHVIATACGSMALLHVSFFSLSLLIFNWRINALQFCVGFCCITWISYKCIHTHTHTHTHTYTPSFLKLPPTSPPTPCVFYMPGYKLKKQSSLGPEAQGKRTRAKSCSDSGSFYLAIQYITAVQLHWPMGITWPHLTSTEQESSFLL